MRRLLIVLILLCASTSWAAISQVGSGFTCSDGVSQSTCTYTGGVTAGNFLAIQMGGRTGSWVVTGATDPTNGAWTCDAEANISNGTSGASAAICYFPNTAGTGSDLTVTVSYNGDATTYGYATQWSGVTASTPKDDFAEATDAASQWTHGSITTTGAALILTAAVINATIASPSALDSFTILTTNVRFNAMYRIVTGSTTTDGPWTDTSGGADAAGAIASFTEAAGAPAVNFFQRRLQVQP